MKILFLTFNYDPDLGAGSFRSKSIVNTLVSDLETFHKIEVITTIPNRYKNFDTKTNELEEIDSLVIHRVKLPNYFSNNLRLIINFIYFAYSALQIIKHNQYDLIFATSSRLLTGVLGAYISYKKKIPYYLDIRDIFLDNISEIYPRVVSILIYPFLSLLEKFMVTQAKKINLISKGFSEYFMNKYPNKIYDYFTNGIDEDFVKQEKFHLSKKNDKIEILYAGNIGTGQGLSKILPQLSSRIGKSAIFRVVGDGGDKKKLINEIIKNKASNIELIEPIKREKLLEYYQSADILFLHLNDIKSFERVLPSKLFEYGAIGKPIFAGLKGYPKAFLQNELTNSYIFDPCDVEGAFKTFKKIKINTQENSKFIKKYLRSNVSKNMVKSILELNE